MKILAVYGSPNKKGNSGTIVDAVLKGAEKNGHVIDRIYLYDLYYSDCIDCENANQIHQERICVYDDDMTKTIIPKLRTCDLLVVSSPVYMGHITGKLKTFFDRWCTFIEKDFAIRLIKGKKYITVTTSGAPTEVFRKVSEYLEYWLSNFFKMEKVAVIHEGDLMGKGAVSRKKEILENAEKIGKKI